MLSFEDVAWLKRFPWLQKLSWRSSVFIFPYLQTVAALAECHVKIDCLQHFLRHQFKISALVSRFSHFFRNSCACIDAFGAVAASWYCGIVRSSVAICLLVDSGSSQSQEGKSIWRSLPQRKTKISCGMPWGFVSHTMQRHDENIRIDHSSTNNLEGAACLGMMFRHVLGYLNSSMFLQGRVHQKFEGF